MINAAIDRPSIASAALAGVRGLSYNEESGNRDGCVRSYQIGFPGRRFHRGPILRRMIVCVDKSANRNSDWRRLVACPSRSRAVVRHSWTDRRSYCIALIRYYQDENSWPQPSRSLEKKQKYFTVEEANKALPLVRMIVSDIVRQYRVVEDLQQRLSMVSKERRRPSKDVYSGRAGSEPGRA